MWLRAVLFPFRFSGHDPLRSLETPEAKRKIKNWLKGVCRKRECRVMVYVKTSIFLCHGIKRWYLREWSIMDTFLNTWYFISLRSNRFRFLVASGRSARDAREQEKKNPRVSCALSLFLLGGCGAYVGVPNDCFLWNICPEKQNLFRIFYSLTKAKNRSIQVQFSKLKLVVHDLWS